MMELWLQGALLLLQGGGVTLLAAWAHRYERLRSISAGTVVGLSLFAWLTEGLHQCSTLILTSALALGMILSVFLRESTPGYRKPLWGGWLMIHACLQASGLLPCLSLHHLLPVGIALRDEGLRLADLWQVLPMLAGLAAGYFWTIPARWQGLLLSLGCGALLQGIDGQERKHFAGGIAIGVILSFI